MSPILDNMVRLRLRKDLLLPDCLELLLWLRATGRPAYYNGWSIYSSTVEDFLLYYETVTLWLEPCDASFVKLKWG